MTDVTKATNELKAKIAGELYRAVSRLTDDPDLLSIIGSYGDTLDDEDILDMLVSYNATGSGFDRVVAAADRDPTPTH